MAAISGAKVAIAADFLNAFAAIPKNQQGKVLEFITKFKANPLASGIHYEKITQFKDPTLRSVRIDKNYRGIVKKAVPEPAKPWLRFIGRNGWRKIFSPKIMTKSFLPLLPGI